MTKVQWSRKLVVLLAAITVIVAGCGGGSGDGDDQADTTAVGRDDDIRIITVSQLGAEHPFFAPIKNGADAAAEDVGVTHEFLAPAELTIEQYVARVDQAIASKPDGLVLIYWDEDALKPKIEEAQEAGITVVTMNTGDGIFTDAGVQVHVGQSEYAAGVAAGQRLAAGGATVGLCINHAEGDLALEERCSGFEEGMTSAGARVIRTVTDFADPIASKNRILSVLASNPEIDAILATGTDSADPALEALGETDQLGSMTLANFDLSPSVLDAIEDGYIEFAVDQQQYLQGYLPIVFIANQVRYGVMPVGLVQTGPGFVTAENVEQVRSLVEQGIR
jgi:simple sugar transport system substrate-binding protein